MSRSSRPPSNVVTAKEAVPQPGRQGSLTDHRIGEVLVGRYRLDKLVGKGGMGRVYRANQFPLNRPVAVKILNPEFQKKDPQFVRRFFLEAASAARLSHPNTITVFDYGEAESGELFIVMEYLQGRPLSRMISSEGPFPAERILHVAMQICRALREAHSKGIIHRDLKPGNILLLEEGDDSDFVKVLDFGLVKLFNADGENNGLDDLSPDPNGELTKAGMFLGSPKYMSPEQIQGKRQLDPRTDIYSLGVLMYHMAAGRPPFTGATSVEVIYKHVNHPVPPFSDLGLSVPFELEDVIVNCLSKRPDDRFESMGALLVRLKDVRRLVTGVSAASETGIDIDLGNFNSVAPRPIVTGDSQDLVRQGAMRGRTSGSHTPIAASTIPREAAFADPVPIEDTGSGVLLAGAGVHPPSKLVKIAPVVAGLAFFIVLGVLAYVWTTRPGSAVSSPGTAVVSPIGDPQIPVPPPTPLVEVRFTSRPTGAKVFDDGVMLGRTPLIQRMPPTREGASPHQFMFKMDGRREVVKSIRLEGTQIVVNAELPKRTETSFDSDPADNDEDYKDNPY